MNWEQLLSLKRHGDTNKRLRNEQDETRLGFDVDYDRIIFSPEFRSLQDKTQVVPLSSTDFVHTRLTHSLEVSVVARSLGRRVGVKVLEKHPYLKEIHGYKSNDFGAIVAAAALAHDIGNPPFGHSGEKAIGHYFKNGIGQQFKAKMTPKEYQDLCDFEGNANGFKVLTQDKQGSKGGLRLSYATLGAFTKYPKGSIPIKPSLHIKDKKEKYNSARVNCWIFIKYKINIVKNKLNLLLAFALVLVSSYIISSSIFPVIIYLSHVKKLTKKPNDRSSHDKSVPTLGGLAIFIGLSITTALVTIIMGDKTEISEILSIVTTTTILLFIGIKDDLMEISSRKKFLTQLVAVLLLILLTGNHITDFYGLLGIHSIPRLLCIGFTVFVYILIINAYNLIDGIDGLAAGIAIVFFGFCGTYFIVNSRCIDGFLSFLLNNICHIIFAFSPFNFPKAGSSKEILSE